ncbi:MAG: lactate dehydrogenase [Verrucomicrobiales bacterium]|nr:lactate dehydrogenase [Verrucomicrobiales bacterium]
MPKVLMGRLTAELWLPNLLHKFRNAGWEIAISEDEPTLSEKTLLAAVGDVDAVLAHNADQWTATVMDAAPQLRVISRTGVGFDNVDLLAAQERGIVVTTTPGSNAEAVADLTLALMLALARKLIVNDQRLKQGVWDPILANDLHFKTVGILGLGRVGRAVARRAAAFRMEILGYDPFVEPSDLTEANIQAVDPDTLYQSSDFVTLHLPSTPETAGLVNARVLGLMKSSAFLINTARGSLVDEKALAAGLQEGQIAGAGLDVFSTEPVTASPLVGFPNVIASPHLAGNTKETMEFTGAMAVDNALAVMSGDWPDEVVVNEVYSPRSTRTQTS